jgi:hypothetical protein
VDPMKLVRLIKTCLNETYTEVRIGKHLSDNFLFIEWSKTSSCIIASASHLYFRICRKKGPRKPDVSEIKWDISASGPC